MPREFSRSTRVAEQIRREISELVRTAVKDPAARVVTITGVDVTRDISVARVHFSLLDDNPEAVAAATAALDRASGFLRRELGQAMQLRHVPQLRFHYDRSLAEGARMDALIAAARKRDRSGEEE